MRDAVMRAPRRTRAGIVILCLLLGAILPIWSYELTGASWSGNTAPYRINGNFPSVPGGTGAQQVAALRCAADAWHFQGTTPFRFDYRGTTAIDEADDTDGVNAVFYSAEVASGGGLASTFYVYDSFDHLVSFDIVFYGENDFGEIEWNGVGDPTGDQLDICATAIHEFGHALGLDHSTNADATMYMYENGVQARALHDDDIDGVQALYGVDSDVSAAPHIDDVEPPSGSIEGGNEVVITGGNFTWEADTVLRIGGVVLARTKWNLENCSTLRILDMPEHAAGAVSFEIENELGSVLLSAAYLYEGGVAPEVLSLAPGAGPIAGGAPVLVFGSGFSDDADVTFDGVPLTDIVVENGTQISGRTPAASGAGTVDVTVSQDSGESTLVDGYLYTSDLLRVEDTVYPPGAIGAPVRILASHEEDLSGFSFGIDFDSEYLTVTDVSVDDTAAEGAGFVGVIRNNDAEPGGGFWTIGVAMDLSPPLDLTVLAASDNVISVATFDVSPDAPRGTVVDLVIRGDVGTPEVGLQFLFGTVDVLPTTLDGHMEIDGHLFVRGDASGNGTVALGDAIKILQHLFSEGPLDCADTADADDSGALSLLDPLRVLRFLFLGGDPPRPPYPEAGFDPTADDLLCE